MNWASRITNRAAIANRVTMSHSPLKTGFRRVMHKAALTMARLPNHQKIASVPCAASQVIRSLALRVGRVPQRRDRVGLRAQALEVVHEPVARVLRVLVVDADVDRLLGTDLLAVAAEHATELVDLVDQRVAVPLLVLPGHELDAVGGADLRAEPAGDALGAPLLVGEHPVRAAPAPRDGPVVGGLFLRVLHRHLGPEQVLQREGHALERGPHVGGLGPRSLQHLHVDRHQASPRASDPEMRCPRSSAKNNGMARSTFRPNSASAKRVSYVQPSLACSSQMAAAITVM